MFKKKLLVIILAAMALMLVLVAAPAFGAGGQGKGGPLVVHALGIAKVQGQDALVDVTVVVPRGRDPREVANEALAAQGARPFDSAGLGSKGFTITGLVWDNQPVVQNYNPGSDTTKPEPASLNGNGGTALTNTHGTWDGVTTSFFDINSGGITDRCPSLVRECKGPQFFDGKNDVAWLQLQKGILGVTWFSTSIDEADIALSTRFTWNDGCVDVENSFDAQAVFLHENGHTVGLGHSDDKNAIMYKYYLSAQCALGTDDNEGVTYLYDADITGSVSGTVKDDANNPIEGALVELQDTGLSATTAADGNYTISDVPDPVTYTVNASADGFEGSTIDRLLVGSTATANFTLTATGGGGGGGDGDGGLTGTLDVNVAIDPPGPFVNRDRVHIFFTVTQNGPVEGVAVHVRIVTPNPMSDLGGNFTTDTNGEVHTHYKVNAGRDGTGTYHVHAEVDKDQASGECLEADACHADFTVD